MKKHCVLASRVGVLYTEVEFKATQLVNEVLCGPVLELVVIISSWKCIDPNMVDNELIKHCE